VVKLKDPLGPLELPEVGPRRFPRIYVALIVVLGAMFLWLLMSRNDGPEPGDVREVSILLEGR